MNKIVYSDSKFISERKGIYMKCWSCKKEITDEESMVVDGPFEDGEKHYYCSTECWMG